MVRKKRKGKARYARGGLATGALGSGRIGVEVGRGPGRGGLSSLGTTARLGGLGDASRPRSGFNAARSRSVGGAGGPLEGSPLPRPGRGSNSLLATAATPYHEASDRLSRLRGKII